VRNASLGGRPVFEGGCTQVNGRNVRRKKFDSTSKEEGSIGAELDSGREDQRNRTVRRRDEKSFRISGKCRQITNSMTTCVGGTVRELTLDTMEDRRCKVGWSLKVAKKMYSIFGT